MYHTRCTNRTICTLPNVPSVPYQVYQLYQVYRTRCTMCTVPIVPVFLMYQMYCTKKTTQKRQKTTQKRQKNNSKKTKNNSNMLVQSSCSLGRTKHNWNGTWVQYRWYSWCSTGGTVGAVQMVQLVQYRWYSWCSIGTHFQLRIGTIPKHFQLADIFFLPQWQVEFNSCLNSGISIAEKYASQWCQKIPCACLPVLCYSALGQDKANASRLPYIG